MLYSVDTSTFVNAWWKHYPPDHFPALWERIDELIVDGSARSTMEVQGEVARQVDELREWLDARAGLFVEIDGPVQLAVRDILRNFPRLIEAKKKRSGADPFVIGLAAVEGCAVVSEETAAGTLEKPRIPDVCEAMGIRHLNLLGLIRERGWVFR